MSKEDEVDISTEQSNLVAAVQTRSNWQAEAAAETAAAVVAVEEDSGNDDNNSNDNE